MSLNNNNAQEEAREFEQYQKAILSYVFLQTCQHFIKNSCELPSTCKSKYVKDKDGKVLTKLINK